MELRRPRKLLPALALLALASSCDRSAHDAATASDPTLVQIQPRILLDNGMPVVPVDSVRMTVHLDGTSTPFFDSTVGFGAKRLAAPGIPVGARWTLSVYGLHRSSDGLRMVVWWKGTRTGIADATPGHVDFDTTFVSIQDTLAPQLSSASGFPQQPTLTLPSGTTEHTITFSVSPSDSVYLTDSTYTRDSLLHSSNGPTSYVLKLKVPSAVFIKVVDSAGNASKRKLVLETDPLSPPLSDTTRPTISFVTPPQDTEFTNSRDTLDVEVAPRFKGDTTGIDSVFVGTKRLSSPWKARVALTPGTNIITATAYANKGLSGSKTLTVTLPRLQGGDNLAPSITRGAGMPPKQGEPLQVPWSTDSVNLSWIITDPSGLIVTLDGSSLPAVSANTLTVSRPLAYNLNEFFLHAKDTLGSSSFDTVRILRLKDTTHPKLTRASSLSSTTPLPFAIDSFRVAWTVSDSDTVASVRIAGAAASSKDGTWGRTIQIPRKLEGFDTTIAIEASDRWGITSRDTVVLHVSKDDSGPTLVRSASTHDDGVAHATTEFTAEWTVRDPGGVKSVTINDSTLSSSDSVQRRTIPLANTTTVIRIVAVDMAGNPRKDSITITRLPESSDTTPPTITRSSGMPKTREHSVAWDVKSFTFSYEISDASTIRSAVMKGKALTLESNAYSITLPLQVGTDTFALVATDGSGVKAHDTLILTREADAVRPVIDGPKTISVPFNTPIAKTTWVIKDQDSVKTVTIDNKIAWLKSDSLLTIEVDLRKARSGYDTTVRIQAIDRTNNTTTDSLRITVRPDTIKPEIRLVSPANRDTLLPWNTKSFDFAWKISDNDSMDTVICNSRGIPLRNSEYTSTLFFNGMDSIKVKIVAYDLMANMAVDSFYLRKNKTPSDTTRPTVVRKRPAPPTSSLDVEVGTSSYDLAWTISDPNLKSVTVNNTPAVFYSSLDEYSLIVPLDKDSMRFIMTAKDSFDNTTSDTVYIKIVGATKVYQTAPGFASLGGGTTGGGVQSSSRTIDTVTTIEELKAKANTPGAGIIFVQGSLGTWPSYDATLDLVEVQGNKTILGILGASVPAAFVLRGSNIIIRNLTIQGPGGNATISHPLDAIDISGVTNVWIDHCRIVDAQGNSVHIRNGADFVTISRTRFDYRSSFVSGTDTAGKSWNGIKIGDSTTSSTTDQGKLRVTIYQSIWESSVAKPIPYVRYGLVHVINNILEGHRLSTYPAILAGQSANLLVEGNSFSGYSSPAVKLQSTATGQTVDMKANNSFSNADSTLVLKNATNVFVPAYKALATLDPTNLSTQIISNGGYGPSIKGWTF